MRLLEVARGALGACEILAPDAVAAHLLGLRSDPPANATLRVLGVRHVAQAAALICADTAITHRVGGVVDLLHALSMAGLAAVDSSRRRAASIDCCVAGCFAVLEFVAAGRASRH